MTLCKAASWAEKLVLLIGLALLGQWSATAIAAHLYQRNAARVLDRWDARSETVASDPLPENPAPTSRAKPTAKAARVQAESVGLVGRIAIPSIALMAVIGEGTNSRTLSRAVGHVRGSAFPGERGNVSIAGHRDTYFRKLGKVQHGDLIRITTSDGNFEYRVFRSSVVSPRRVELLRDHGGSMVTLVTCYPFNAIGPAPDRYIIQARQVASSRPAMRSRPGA